jgi:hypothetical protein
MSSISKLNEVIFSADELTRARAHVTSDPLPNAFSESELNKVRLFMLQALRVLSSQPLPKRLSDEVRERWSADQATFNAAIAKMSDTSISPREFKEFQIGLVALQERCEKMKFANGKTTVSTGHFDSAIQIFQPNPTDKAMRKIWKDFLILCSSIVSHIQRTIKYVYERYKMHQDWKKLDRLDKELQELKHSLIEEDAAHQRSEEFIKSTR